MLSGRIICAATAVWTVGSIFVGEAASAARGACCPPSGGFVGVSISRLDNEFTTALRSGIDSYARDHKVEVLIEDAQGDFEKQLRQVQDFIAQKVDAVIVDPVESASASNITKILGDANIPLVYVGQIPGVKDQLTKAFFVGSDEVEAGRLEAREICQMLKMRRAHESATLVVLKGPQKSEVAERRTRGVHETIGTPECSFIKITDEQTADWDRKAASALMTRWIDGHRKPDAIVANNDEMAIGAIQSLGAASISVTGKVLIGGIDASSNALAEIRAGALDVTVFQSPSAKGSTALDTALRLAFGGKAENLFLIPSKIVTRDNIKSLFGEKLKDGAP